MLLFAGLIVAHRGQVEWSGVEWNGMEWNGMEWIKCGDRSLITTERNNCNSRV